MMLSEPQLWIWYTPHGMGGVETYLRNMTAASLGRGLRPAVAAVTPAPGRLATGHPAGVEHLDWTAFEAAYMGRAPQEPVQQRLAADLARLQPRLLVLNDCVDFALGVLPLLGRLRPWCTLVDVLHIDAPDDAYFERRAPFLDLLDGVVGTSERALQRLAAAGARCPRRYVRNGARVPALPRHPRSEVLRLLYVGRLEQAQKRVGQIPDVLGRLTDLGRLWRLTVVGDGPERGPLQAALEARGLSGSVVFRGALPGAEAVASYFEHDVLLSLSTYEGLSLSMLEALAAGCVPVCTDLPSLDHSIFEDGVTCRACPIERPDLVAEALASLSRADLERLSDAGRKRAQALTPEATCAGYLEFVAELRRARSLAPWPDEAQAILGAPWDLTRLNPWLPRPSLLRRLGRALFRARA